ncbi:MAG: Acylphosphate phosphohydrolase [Deltaproteobacteria bacterium]|nr:Acylphosphate phosphohydrolase [Deltaproteobacteria bacterium]
MKTRAHIIVHGIVQGVYFRYRTQQEATGLDLTGWVKNLPDGSVEIMCEGEKEAVETLVRWSRTGPSGAFVERADVSFEKYTGGFPTFEIRH